MDEFEFVTISNGEAVVRHTTQGHVFRFKPWLGSDWSVISFSRREIGENATEPLDQYNLPALDFTLAYLRRIEALWQE